MSKWFTANKLALRLDKNKAMTFIINNLLCCAFSGRHNENCIKEAVNYFIYKLQRNILSK
jgi:hypothetical protein